ncbi:MAG: helix-turn-helix transcriptional regulator [Tepidiformaceae bacterium]
MTTADESDGPAELAFSPSEVLLLEYVRAGMPDAEIAVRLGVSNGDARQRIDRLCNRLGVSGREGLRLWRPAGKSPSAGRMTGGQDDAPQRRDAAVRVLIGAVAAVAVVLALFLLLRDEAAAPTAAPGLESVATDTPAATAAATAAPTVPVSVVGGRLMFDAGLLFRASGSSPGSGIANTSPRESLVLVDFSGPSLLRFDLGVVRWSRLGSSPGIALLTATVSGHTYRLLLGAGDKTTVFLHGDGGIEIYSQAPGGRPVVTLTVDNGAGNDYHAELGLDGRLYLSTDPIALNLAIERSTGEALDISAAVRLPPLGPRFAPSTPHFTDCLLGPCRGVWRGGQIALPVSARLTCDVGGPIQLAAADFTLVLTRLDFSGCEVARDLALPMGSTLIPPAPYEITAFIAGEQIDVGLARDGTLYIGTITPLFGCPCRFDL